MPLELRLRIIDVEIAFYTFEYHVDCDHCEEILRNLSEEKAEILSTLREQTWN